MSTLKKWHEVYANDEELRFFVGADKNSGLVRSNYKARSTEALERESGLTTEQVEKIINKYIKPGIVVASDSRENHWYYWENVDTKEKVKSVADTDQADRLKKK